MKLKHNTSEGQAFEYDENIWTGKKNLVINGAPAEKLTKKEFKFEDTSYRVKGSFLSGVSLITDKGDTIVLCKNAWWEWVLIFVSFLYLGLGIFGGAIGGALSAVAAFLVAAVNALVLRTDMNVLIKVIMCLAFIVIGFFVWFGLYILIATAILGINLFF
jgi:hypothetical protein